MRRLLEKNALVPYKYSNLPVTKQGLEDLRRKELMIGMSSDKIIGQQ